MKTSMSLHATKRCAQRGVRPDDVALALQIGTAIDDGIFVRDADVDMHVAPLKRQIMQLQRLKGLYIACSDRAVVTAYRDHVPECGVAGVGRHDAGRAGLVRRPGQAG